MAAASKESVVRRIVDDINVRIRDINRRGAEGPPSSVMPAALVASLNDCTLLPSRHIASCRRVSSM